MANEEIVQRAKFGPIRSANESRLSALEINGKNNIFEACPFESQLRDFVQAKQLLGLSINDQELKDEVCRIIGRMEEVSATPSDFIADWLVKLVHSSGDWLSAFRERAGVTQLETLVAPLRCSNEPSIQDYTKLEREMTEYLNLQRGIGVEPLDSDLRRQARVLLHGSDTGQTAADDDFWLAAFKQRHAPNNLASPISLGQPSLSSSLAMFQLPTGTGDQQAPENHYMAARSIMMKSSTLFLNDHNYYRWFTEELGRWVVATMSPHNPASHVPTDEEIQHYSRWITYHE